MWSYWIRDGRLYSDTPHSQRDGSAIPYVRVGGFAYDGENGRTTWAEYELRPSEWFHKQTRIGTIVIFARTVDGQWRIMRGMTVISDEQAALLREAEYVRCTYDSNILITGAFVD